jgi:hypothetical protein
LHLLHSEQWRNNLTSELGGTSRNPSIRCPTQLLRRIDLQGASRSRGACIAYRPNLPRFRLKAPHSTHESSPIFSRLPYFALQTASEIVINLTALVILTHDLKELLGRGSKRYDLRRSLLYDARLGVTAGLWAGSSLCRQSPTPSKSLR